MHKELDFFVIANKITVVNLLDENQSDQDLIAFSVLSAYGIDVKASNEVDPNMVDGLFLSRSVEQSVFQTRYAEWGSHVGDELSECET